MQNKLYFLDESEKSRILNLHENRTNKKYLVNDVISEIESFIWGVSKDEKILFTETKIFFMEGETPKSLEYNLESLPHLLNVLKKEYDKRLTEGSINLVKYFSIPRKFLSEITKSLDSNIHKKILKEWDDKFNSNFRLLNENVELITESLKTKELWDDVVVLTEQVWSYLSNLGKSAWEGVKSVGKAVGSAAKSVGNAAWSGIKAVGGAIWAGISSAAKAIIMPIITKGLLPFLWWIRRNLKSYIGIITEVILSFFPTVVIVKAVWSLIIIVDIYEILTGNFDPQDPDRKQMPFLFLITDLISLFFTSLAGSGVKATLKTAIKQGASKETKNLLKSLLNKLPYVSSALNYVKNLITKIFGKSAGDFLGKVFSGVDSVVSQLSNWIIRTFKLGKESVKQSAQQLLKPKGVLKLTGGAALGVGIAEFFKENTLTKGMTGELIKQAQKGLTTFSKIPPKINYRGTITGTFDDETENAVKRLQAHLKLPVNGKIDPRMGMVLGVDFGPGNLEKLVGSSNMKTIGERLLATNQWLEKTFGSLKGIV